MKKIILIGATLFVTSGAILIANNNSGTAEACCDRTQCEQDVCCPIPDCPFPDLCGTPNP